MITVAHEGRMEPGAFAVELCTLVRTVRIVLRVLVLAPAPYDPRTLGNNVVEGFALAFGSGALVTSRCMFLQSMSTHAATLLANHDAIIVALLTAPREYGFRLCGYGVH